MGMLDVSKAVSDTSMGHQLRHEKSFDLAMWIESSIFELWPQGLSCEEPNLKYGEITHWVWVSSLWKVLAKLQYTKIGSSPHLNGSIGDTTCLLIKTVKQPPVFLEWNSHLIPTQPMGPISTSSMAQNMANHPVASSWHISKLGNKAP